MEVGSYNRYYILLYNNANIIITALGSFCIKILTEDCWECAALKKFCEVDKENLKVLSFGFNDSVKYFIYPVENFGTLFAKVRLK